jgi:hypothetical protein
MNESASMTQNLSLISLTDEEQPCTMPSSEQAQSRRQVGLVVLGTLVLLVLGILGNWPWLMTEHARLEPVQHWLIWAADGTALLWTLWFGLWHGVLGKPVPAGPATDRAFRWVLLTLLAGMAVDVSVTAASAYQEAAGYRRAVLSPQAELTGGRPSLNGHLAYVTCRFQDQAGDWHESHLSLELNRHPPGLGAAIRAGQFPVPVSIKYDPDWPPRCWPSPTSRGEHQPLFLLSLCALLFQGLLTFATVAVYRQGRPSAWRVPLYKFVPVWGIMLPLCCGAVGKLLEGEL